LALETAGHEVSEAASASSALQQIEQRPCSLALVDLQLGRESGLDLVECLLESRPRLALIGAAAHGSIDSAMDAMRRGACGYLLKPISPTHRRAVLERVARIRVLRDRLADLEQTVRAEVLEAMLESPDPAVRCKLERARRVAPTNAPVVLRGERGTGKGVLARALHGWSETSTGPFIAVNCYNVSSEPPERSVRSHRPRVPRRRPKRCGDGCRR
jgi:NtrC-family two-component system response regulator AlgB